MRGAGGGYILQLPYVFAPSRNRHESGYTVGIGSEFVWYSKVLVVSLYSKCTRALTFQNFCPHFPQGTVMGAAYPRVVMKIITYFYEKNYVLS